MSASSSWLVKLHHWAILVSYAISLNHFLLFSFFLSCLLALYLQASFLYPKVLLSPSSFLLPFSCTPSPSHRAPSACGSLLPAASASLSSAGSALGLIRNPAPSPCILCHSHLQVCMKNKSENAPLKLF